MNGEQIVNYGVVLVMVGRILITRRYTVAGYNGAVHHFRGADQSGQRTLCVYAVHVSIVQESLALQHHDVTDARQIFPLFFKCFRDGRRLVDDCLVRNEFSRQFTDRRGCSQPREPCGRLILVLFEVLNRFHNEHEIVQL